MHAKRWFPIAFVGTIIIIVATLFYYFNLKQGYHIDELYTYGLSNSYYQPMPFDHNQWLDGSYYLNYLSPTIETRFAYDSVYYNQVQDVHPPLYYFIVHTVSSIFPGVFTKWIGLSINGVLHILIFVLLYFLLKTITKKPWISLAGSAFWALSVGALSSAVFIRMYQLVTLWQLALLYLLVNFLNKSVNIKWALLGVALLVYLGGLTHYYFYVYAFLLVATVCLIFLFQKRFKDLFAYGMSAVAGVLAAFATFPAVFTHLFDSNRGTEVLENAENLELTRQNLFVVFIKHDLFLDIRLRYVLLFAIILSAFLLIFIHKNKYHSLLTSLVLVAFPAVTYVFLVQQLSHYQTPRYIYSVYPILVASLVVILYYGLRGLIRNQKIVTSCVMLLLATGSIYSLMTTLPEYLFLYKPPLVSLVEDSQDQAIMVLGDEYWKVAREVDDLAYFDQIYPSIITNSLTNLPDTVDKEQLYVLMMPNENNDVPKVIANIANKYQMTVVEETLVEQDEILYKLIHE